tara:strand:- start:18964 stop:19830 length:867 start_codon:yes stop_codon:yes gene_type:complete
MLPVVICILLLAFIGIYINVYKTSTLNDPELLRLPKMFRTNKPEKREDLNTNEISADEVATRLVEEKLGNNNIYDAVGNIVARNKDFKNTGMIGGGDKLIDTNLEKLSSIGNKRPYAWHGASSQREWPDNKTVNAGLPYNVYHPLDTNAMKGITSTDNKNNNVKMTGPPLKAAAGEQTVGFFLGKDKTYGELERSQSNKDINQAVAIIRNARANEDKQLVSIDDLDRPKLQERYGKKNNNSISRYTDVRVKPNINTSLTDKDADNVISQKINIDPLGELISQTSKSLN